MNDPASIKRHVCPGLYGTVQWNLYSLTLNEFCHSILSQRSVAVCLLNFNFHWTQCIHHRTCITKFILFYCFILLSLHDNNMKLLYKIHVNWTKTLKMNVHLVHLLVKASEYKLPLRRKSKTQFVCLQHSCNWFHHKDTTKAVIACIGMIGGWWTFQWCKILVETSQWAQVHLNNIYLTLSAINFFIIFVDPLLQNPLCQGILPLTIQSMLSTLLRSKNNVYTRLAHNI